MRLPKNENLSNSNRGCSRGSLAASPAPAFSPILPPDYVRPWCMLEGYGDNEGEHKMVFGKPRRT